MPRYGEKPKGSNAREKQPRQHDRKDREHTSRKILRFPADLSFLWRIDILEPSYTSALPSRKITVGDKKVDNDFIQFWLPPNKKDGVTKVHKGNVYKWHSAGSQLYHKSTSKLKEYSTTSMFVQASQDNLLVVPIDCSTKSVTSTSCGWRSISFSHEPDYLTRVGFSKKEFELAVPADESTWMPQVIPRTYNPPLYGDGSKSLPHPTQGGLCGDLGILIAMAATSTTEQEAEQVVATCFRLGEWCDHAADIGIGRYRERGLVVTIWLDPDDRETSNDVLKHWEQGTFGPIWGSQRTSPLDRRQVSLMEDESLPTNYSTSKEGYSTNAYDRPEKNATPRRMPDSPSYYTEEGGDDTDDYYYDDEQTRAVDEDDDIYSADEGYSYSYRGH